MLKFHVQSLGCPKNRVDTEHLLGAMGTDVALTPHPGRADVIFINTCGFIEPAVRESVRSILDAAAHRERLRRKPLLVVAGCLVGRYGAQTLGRDLPEVDLWLDNADLARWPWLLNAALAPRLRKPEERLTPQGRLGLFGHGSAYLKISDGCRHHCAFCTIPGIRGPHRSIPAALLVDEARMLLGQGVGELVLVAQDSTAWGEDVGEERGLVGLLERLLPLKGLRWLRLMYLYPAGITDALLRLMREAAPVLLPYFDIPLQHAHPDILRAMGRPFARDPRLVLDKVRTALPGAAIRTTCITGFPGETPAHFQALLDFVAEGHFTHMGAFAYSPEEGTVAASLPGQVPVAERERRRDVLMEAQAEASAAALRACVGQHWPVLVEAPHPDWPGLHTGRVWLQAPEVDGVTYISGPGVRPGAFVQADIVESATYDLTALA